MMSHTKKLLVSFNILLLLFCLPLSAEKVDTFYGPIDVEEPVLLELIASPAFQRLKEIHQYGVSYYTTHREEYTRYAHSVGVFAILRKNHCSLETQIAGLLHDVSHTVFSHVGDWIFGKAHRDKDYQNSIHSTYLENCGIGEILKKYGISVDQILPEEHLHPALEQKNPNLCADRIDYNIQGAFFQHYITYEEALEIYEEIQYINGKWVSSSLEKMKKLADYSIFMSQDCWGSPTNYVMSSWLADAILRAIDIHLITFQDIHYGTDNYVWETLLQSDDFEIRTKMNMIINSSHYFFIVDPLEADFVVKSKFRGIDPWIHVEGNTVRLTTFDEAYGTEFYRVKERMEKTGWGIRVCSP